MLSFVQRRFSFGSIMYGVHIIMDDTVRKSVA